MVTADLGGAECPSARVNEFYTCCMTLMPPSIAATYLQMSGAVHSSPAHRLLLANLPTSLPLAALRAGLLARLVPPAAILDLRLLPAGAEAGTATALLALDSAAAADTVLAALHLTPPLNLRVVPAGAQGERVARRVEGVARAAVTHGDMEVQVKVEAKEEIKEDIVNTENGVEIQAEEIGNKEEIMDVEEEEVFNFGELVVVEEELGECSGCGGPPVLVCRGCPGGPCSMLSLP